MPAPARRRLLHAEERFQPRGAGGVGQAEEERGAGGDPGPALPRRRARPFAGGDASGMDGPAVALQQGFGRRGIVGVRVPALDPRREGTGWLQRDGADGGPPVALEDLLDGGRLVDQLLDGLAKIQLGEDLPAVWSSPVELKVVGDVIEGPGIEGIEGHPRRMLRSLGRPVGVRRRLGDVGQREITHVATAITDGGLLGAGAGEGKLDEGREGRGVRPRVAAVAGHGHGAGRAERRQTPWSVDHLPELVRCVGRRLAVGGLGIGRIRPGLGRGSCRRHHRRGRDCP